MKHQMLQTVIVILAIIFGVLLIITLVIRNYNKQILSLVKAVERQHHTVFEQATNQLFEDIYELDITNNRPANESTERYFESLGAPAGTPYDKALKIIAEKQIHRLFFESHWMYRKHLQKMRDYMGIPITFKIGVETFDKTFREEYLNKHADFDSPEEVRKYFDSPCLMVGIKGQTKEMIDYDIRMLKTHFELGTVNVFTNNSTDVKRDQELVDWFMQKYADLLEDPSVEVLYEKSRFRCGGLICFCFPVTLHSTVRSLH